MQETTWDGEITLTDCPSFDAFLEATTKKENRYVAMHREGSIITDHKGQKYKVQKDGSWKKTTSDLVTGEPAPPQEPDNEIKDN